MLNSNRNDAELHLLKLLASSDDKKSYVGYGSLMQIAGTDSISFFDQNDRFVGDFDIIEVKIDRSFCVARMKIEGVKIEVLWHQNDSDNKDTYPLKIHVYYIHEFNDFFSERGQFSGCIIKYPNVSFEVGNHSFLIEVVSETGIHVIVHDVSSIPIEGNLDAGEEIDPKLILLETPEGQRIHCLHLNGNTYKFFVRKRYVDKLRINTVTNRGGIFRYSINKIFVQPSRSMNGDSLPNKPRLTKPQAVFVAHLLRFFCPWKKVFIPYSSDGKRGRIYLKWFIRFEINDEGGTLALENKNDLIVFFGAVIMCNEN